MKLGSLILCASILASASVYAQTPAPTPEMQAARQAMHAACDADMKSMCAGKEGHEGAMCLREHADKVSAGCKDAMAKMPKPGGTMAPASK